MTTVNDLPPLLARAAIDFTWNNTAGTVSYSVGSDNYPPTVDARYQALYTAINNAITFTATANLPAGLYPVEYRWAFGDRTTGSGISVTHTYSVEVPDLQCTLTVIDNYGKQYKVSRVMNMSKIRNTAVTIERDVFFTP